MKLTIKTNGDEISSIEHAEYGYVKIATPVGSIFLSKEALRVLTRWSVLQDELSDLEQREIES